MATRAEKQVVVEEIIERLKNSGAVYVTEYVGMNVAQINKLRSKFREKNITYKVYKNKLMKRAMEEIGGYDKILPTLKEQTAFAFSDADPASPAKVLKDFLKESKDKPKFKSAYIDGSVYGEEHLEALSTMKSKDEVIGDIIGLLQSPIRNVVSALQSQGSTIVGAIKTISEKES